jgi:DNA-binding GntR family transcriptional regulator
MLASQDNLDQQLHGSEKAASDLSYARQSYDFIIRQIFDGGLKPGDEINRKKLASELGISLAPVSEAVNQLESEGFLEISPRRQTRVRIVTKDEVRGLLILREALECHASRLYCGDLVTSRKKPLLEIARKVDSSEAGSKGNEMTELLFHQSLVDLVDCPLLSAEFQKVMRRKVFMKINLIVPWNAQPPLDSHERLLTRLCKSNPDAAEKAMREHLERGRERILR